MGYHITLNDTVETPFVPIGVLLGRFNGGAGFAGLRVRVGGWVKAGIEEGKGTFALLELNDGLCRASLRVIVDATVADLSPLVATGTLVVVEGSLKETPEGTEQKIELLAEQVILVETFAMAPIVSGLNSGIAVNALGHGDPDWVKAVVHQANILSQVEIPGFGRIRISLAFVTYPLFQEYGFPYCEGAGEMFQATNLTSNAQKLEELIKNLRPSEAAKVLGKVTAAALPFFQEHGFLYGHTPFITTSDCEGAGEMFQATTLISDAQKLEELIKNLRPSEAATVLFKVRIAMVRKYTGLSDSYLSVLKKRIMEGSEVSTGQSREDQMHVSRKFKEIECQCAQLREETNLISQQIKGTKLRLLLLSKISKARKHEDFVKARKLTIRLRKLIASQNEEERAIKMTTTSTKD